MGTLIVMFQGVCFVEMAANKYKVTAGWKHYKSAIVRCSCTVVARRECGSPGPPDLTPVVSRDVCPLLTGLCPLGQALLSASLVTQGPSGSGKCCVTIVWT